MNATTPPEQSDQPLVSLLLACYEQQDVVERAVHAALAQTYSPLEILISDDASCDDTFARIEHAVRDYRGPHSVLVRRNAHNEGISAHFSRLAQLANGELLFVAAGDDVSEPLRCERVVSHWLALQRGPDLIATDLIDIDTQGQVHRLIRHADLNGYTLEQWCTARPWLVGASHAWSKRLFTRFGPMRSGAHAEDQIMLLRAVLANGASTLREPLVRWRRGGLSGKRRPVNLNALRQQMQRGNRASLAALQQHLEDARLMHRLTPIQAALAPQLARVHYTAAMLEQSGITARLRAFRDAHDVSLGYRLRLLGYTLLPWPYDGFIRLKARLNLTRHSDAAGRPAQPFNDS